MPVSPNSTGMRISVWRSGATFQRCCSRCFSGGADECAEQRMRLERLRFELGMELAAEVPRMIRDLADLDIHAVRGLACEPQAVLLSGSLRTRD